MDNLRLILIVVATLAIAALLIHGFWINKKERSNIFLKQPKGRNYSSEHVTPCQTTLGELDGENRSLLSSQDGDYSVITETSHLEKYVADTIIGEKDGSPPTQHDFFLENKLNNDEVDERAVDMDEHAMMANRQSESTSLVSPFQEEQGSADRLNPKQINKKRELGKIPPSADVLVMHVAGINGGNLNGSSLLNSILSAGFQHGEMQIFHRHIDPAGNGAILYSLANMVKPGHLNPETMHDMVTPGISLFMMVPSFGDDQQNFKMMLQSAQRIADDVKGVVLDDEYHMITPQKIDGYRNRIKKLISK